MAYWSLTGFIKISWMNFLWNCSKCCRYLILLRATILFFSRNSDFKRLDCDVISWLLIQTVQNSQNITKKPRALEYGPSGSATNDGLKYYKAKMYRKCIENDTKTYWKQQHFSVSDYRWWRSCPPFPCFKNSPKNLCHI